MNTETAVTELVQAAFAHCGGEGVTDVEILRSKLMKQSAKLTLPLPPSVNNMYATVRGRRVLSAEGRRFKKTVKDLVMVGRVPSFDDSEVALIVHVYRARRAGDLDNFLKSLQDSLTGLVWTDDRQVVEIHAYRCEDRENPRAEVVITEL